MLAGGTGITPMYQLIRAICEGPRDTTEVSLVYANRSEGDILLRKELDSFARRYPGNLKVHYLVDQAPEGWTGGTGRFTKELLEDRFPDPREERGKVMLCGPPGMVGAAKGMFIELGWEKAALSSKMEDQVFCFSCTRCNAATGWVVRRWFHKLQELMRNSYTQSYDLKHSQQSH